MYDPNQITLFAETDARNRRVRFGIRAEDRTKHVYAIGKTGMGKSTLLENMAIQDIQNGNGLCFIDPHGKTADLLLEYVPEHRIKDVLYFAPFDMDYPISFNILEDVGYDKRHLVVSGLMTAFKKIWEDAWSARMEYILSNTLFALLEYPDATLLHVNKMLSDKKFRAKVVEHIKDPSVKSFWVDEFANYTERFAADATPAIQNKIGQFTSNPLIRNIIGQPKSSFDVREMMDNQKIFIINLSKGRIGDQNSKLLGSLLVTKMYLSALSRADIKESELKKLPNFYLFVDEFQTFANESFAEILSEARKYKLNLTIAHQYIDQMSESVRSAVFGNIGTMISFRVGPLDAELLEKEFAPVFTSEDFVNLGFAQIYLKLMINNIGSKPFSAKTLAPLPKPENDLTEKIIESSRLLYSKPRIEVEANIKGLHENPKSENNSNVGNNHNSNSNHNKKNKNKESNHLNHNNSNPVIDEKTRIELESALKEKKEVINTLTVEDFIDNIKDKEVSVVKNDIENEEKKIELKHNHPKISKKEITPEHKNELRDALSKLINQDVNTIKDSSKVDNHKKDEKLATDQGVKEIPESELKKVLDID
jgi:hypothetical protein